MRTTARPTLPAPPANLDPVVRQYLTDLNRALERALGDVYRDLADGNTTLTPFAVAPTVQDVNVGQAVIRTDAGNEAIYVNVKGAMKSVGLT